ncbi:restriction endonuclease subunit S [Lactobacillus salivarius]|uniref:Restriction endonuclease subunit S n=3 Tax=Ligilactobacillus salivarius TaxID=1624 RepID=A0A6A8LPT0_9LACO|nr:restriction endonuclease subunit S [Ligilactobacillus salivarius]
MDNKKNGIPKLRFPGFTGAWEQRKLGEVADVRDGTHDSPRYINEGYPLLTSKNVGNGYINYDDVKYVSENDYVQINKRSKVDINDILMGMIGTIGNLALIREEPDFAIKNVALIKHTSNFDYRFLFQELQTSAISKELLSGMDGGTQKFVSLKKIRNLSVMLPSENEQKQIGAFFKQFDSLIALHQRKLEHLQEQKKGLLQKMFPKNGETVPEVRFPGFTDAWEQRKLGEVATFINGRAYKQNELLDSGKYKVLRVGNFYTNDSWYYSNLELADKYYIDEGDLVYTWSATFGPHIWNGEKVIYHYHIWKIELSKFLDRDFTLQILEADKAKLLANTNGSTMIHVTKKDMESKVISLPNIEEQKKIGSYLMKFDSLITLHQRKLEHLELMKKGLLQQMFV